MASREILDNLGHTKKKIREGGFSPNNPILSERQIKFVEYYVDHRMSQTAAARLAGFSHPAETGHKLVRMPKIQKAIAERKKEYAVASQMTKKKVIDGFLEAIDMARIKGDPMSMISGWREIGKMCGFYEPSKTQIEISMNGQLLLHKLNTMSDEELLKLAEGDQTVLEGEFKVLEDETQD